MVINLTESPQSPIVISSSSGRSSSHISKTRKSSSPSSSYDLPLAELQRRIKGKARKKSSSPASSYDLPLAELRRRLPGRQTTTETFPPGLDVTVAGKGDDPATVTAAAIVPGTTAGDTSVVFKFDHQPRRLQDVQALAEELNARDDVTLPFTASSSTKERPAPEPPNTERRWCRCRDVSPRASRCPTTRSGTRYCTR